jgi:osmoprotectant transport system permease protein
MKSLAILSAIFTFCSVAQPKQIVVGSKRFTESYVLGEIARIALQKAGFTVVHKQGMGGTIILWQALRGADIQVYPEYTGTIAEEILKTKQPLNTDGMRALLRQDGVGMTGDLGFNNTYALVMRRDRADKLGMRKISDLPNHPDLKIGLSLEFLDRRDGWAPLSTRYGLQMQNVRGMDHALAYAALAAGSIDLTDAYSTDAKIEENNFVVLDDDLHFFPQYQAVFLYRLDMDNRAVAALENLTGTIDEARMRHLNSEAERTKDYTYAAGLYFGQKYVSPSNNLVEKIGRLTLRHLELVGNHRRHTAWHSSESSGTGQQLHSLHHQRHPDYPVSRLTCVARATPILRDQLGNSDFRFVFIQPVADRSEYRRRSTGDPNGGP